MSVGAVTGGMDLATMKALLSGASANAQVKQAGGEAASADPLALLMTAKTISSARQTLDVWA